MKLSIIIVNYNVRYFLSACLQSVQAAVKNIDAEIFVVDNNSTDQSVEMLRADFPEIILIANNFNAGFSKANNQAIAAAKGEYILLLNPDTIVEEDCFEKCISYMDEHPEAGGMGVKMIDGAGKFLPESKRGLPTPAVAFFKISGLSKLFPKSKRFGKYHLGFLDENEIAEIEILSGAYMFMRKSVIDKIGGLDEAFFMYGEDIDMSYRITDAGFKNVYFPKSRIIHFKGESTKKSSVNYVLVFYRAMIIFAKKHFSQQNAGLFSLLINLAIYLRALIALINRLFTRFYMPLIDLGIFWSILLITKDLYESFVLGNESYYPSAIETKTFPLIIMCLIMGQFLLGGYHQPVKLKAVFKGLLTGSLFVIILYAMLSESMRFSRAIVLLSTLSTFLIIPLSRILLMKMKLFRLIRFTEMNSAIIGGKTEIDKVLNILKESTARKKSYYFVNPLRKSESSAADKDFAFHAAMHQIDHFLDVFNIDEIIFCMKDLKAIDMINIMQKKVVGRCNLYIHPINGEFLLKSSSINSIGEFILPETNPVMPDWSIRKKRIFEVILTAFLLAFSPFLIFIFRRPLRFYLNIFNVIIGNINLIGYKNNDRPFLIEAFPESQTDIKKTNIKIDYLLNYGTEKDLELLLGNLNQLDKNLSIQNL